MNLLNIEIKAQCSNLDRIRNILLSQGAEFKGIDHQVDTYFRVAKGRLKVREGELENSLVYYEREDGAAPKESHVVLVPIVPKSPIKEILVRSLGVLAVVEKRREICFIENVKFHLDTVKDLGTFVEIEAIDVDGRLGKFRLHQQCRSYMEMFEIHETELVTSSYSDLVITATSDIRP